MAVETTIERNRKTIPIRRATVSWRDQRVHAPERPGGLLEAAVDGGADGVLVGLGALARWRVMTRQRGRLVATQAIPFVQEMPARVRRERAIRDRPGVERPEEVADRGRGGSRTACRRARASSSAQTSHAGRRPVGAALRWKSRRSPRSARLRKRCGYTAAATASPADILLIRLVVGDRAGDDHVLALLPVGGRRDLVLAVSCRNRSRAGPRRSCGPCSSGR